MMDVLKDLAKSMLQALETPDAEASDTEDVQELFRLQGILEDASRLAINIRVLPGNERENPEIRRGNGRSGPHGQGSDREGPEAEAYFS